jgi:hypothetical protein
MKDMSLLFDETHTVERHLSQFVIYPSLSGNIGSVMYDLHLTDGVGCDGAYLQFAEKN